MRQCMYCGNKKPLTEFIRGYGKDGSPLYREKTCNDCAERFKAYCVENYSSEKDSHEILKTKLLFAAENDKSRREELHLNCKKCSKYPCYKGQENSKWDFAITCINLDEPTWNILKEKIKDEVHSKKDIPNKRKGS